MSLRKMKREIARRYDQSQGFIFNDILDQQQKIAEEASTYTSQVMIAALLVALKDVLNFGPKRSEAVINNMNETILKIHSKEEGLAFVEESKNRFNIKF